MNPRRIRALAVLATVLAISGCAPSTPTPTPAASLPPSPTVPLAIASLSPTVASPSPISSPTSSPSPSPGTGLGLDWSIDPLPSATKMAVWLAGIDPGGAGSAEFEGGDGFVLMIGDADGRHAVAWTSADGLSWRRTVGRAQTAPLTNVVRWRGHFIGLTGGAVLESSDGLIWRKTATIPNAESMNQLATRGARLVAVGTTVVPSCQSECIGAATAWSTRDGRHWQRSVLDHREGSIASWVFATPTGFVAFSDTFKMWRSADGVRWRRVAVADPPGGVPNSLAVKVVAGSTTYLAADQPDAAPGERASIWISSDARHWRVIKVGGEGTVSTIGSMGPYYVAEGNSLDGYQVLASISLDGETWQQISLPAGTIWFEWVSSHIIAFGQTQVFVSPPVPGEQPAPSQSPPVPGEQPVPSQSPPVPGEQPVPSQ